MTVDHDADIDTDELLAAGLSLDRVVQVMGDVPSLLEAQGHVANVALDLTDLESFEDRFRWGLRHVRLAEDLTNGYHQYATRQHREGRVRISNIEWVHVDACLIDAADALNRWIDYAEYELRQIAA